LITFRIELQGRAIVMRARRIIGFGMIAAIVGIIAWGPGRDDANPVATAKPAVAQTYTRITPDAKHTVVNPSRPSDVAVMERLGSTAVRMGYATQYRVSWGGALELTISSLLPGDARMVADAVCGGSRAANWGWKQPRELRVFILTSSDRPAAVCTL
jgi:hypothetical protein